MTNPPFVFSGPFYGTVEHDPSVVVTTTLKDPKSCVKIFISVVLSDYLSYVQYFLSVTTK